MNRFGEDEAPPGRVYMKYGVWITEDSDEWDEREWGTTNEEPEPEPEPEQDAFTRRLDK